MKLKSYFDKKELSEATEMMLLRSEGLFLYARFLDDILERTSGTLKLTDLRNSNKFPQGLDGVFSQYFQRFLEEGLDGNSQVYQLLVGSLVASREPVPVSVLEDALQRVTSNKRQVRVIINISPIILGCYFSPPQFKGSVKQQSIKIKRHEA